MMGVGGSGGGGEGMLTAGGGAGVAGSKAVASALKSMNKGEMYDVMAKLKEIADTNPDEARRLLTQHPQLPEAILYCMSEVCRFLYFCKTRGLSSSSLLYSLLEKGKFQRLILKILPYLSIVFSRTHNLKYQNERIESLT